MAIGKYNFEGVGDFEAFKDEANLLQQRAGVNPGSCIQIVECCEVNRLGATPADLFLHHINLGLFATPPPSISSEQRLHDEQLHFAKAIGTEPEIGDMYAVIAARGLRRKNMHGWTARILDAALGDSAIHVFNGMAGGQLLPDTTIDWLGLSFSPDYWNRILRLEAEHTAKIFN